jgi:hypothetical protein
VRPSPSGSQRTTFGPSCLQGVVAEFDVVKTRGLVTQSRGDHCIGGHVIALSMIEATAMSLA